MTLSITKEDEDSAFVTYDGGYCHGVGEMKEEIKYVIDGFDYTAKELVEWSEKMGGHCTSIEAFEDRIYDFEKSEQEKVLVANLKNQGCNILADMVQI
jgi:hypothetical protein